MLVAFSGSHQQAASRRSPLTTLSPLAARSSLAVLLPLATFFCRAPLANETQQKTLKPVKRYEHLTGDPRIKESKRAIPPRLRIEFT